MNLAGAASQTNSPLGCKLCWIIRIVKPPCFAFLNQICRSPYSYPIVSELIECEAVGYRQSGIDILTDINWRIDRGQHWAVLGPNGSGKTTLLRIACGYLWPTSGRVLRLGEELIDLGELRRSIGWISSAMIAEIPASDTGSGDRGFRPARANRP